MVEILPFSISKFNQDNNSFSEIFFATAFLTSSAFPASAAAFFCILAKMISLCLDEIHCQVAQEQLKNSKYPLQPSETQPFKQNISSILKKQHILAFKAVQQINRSMGFFLLIKFNKSLIGIINSLACIPIDSVENKWSLITVTSLFVVRELLDVLVVTSSTDSIQSKVLRLLRHTYTLE